MIKRRLHTYSEIETHRTCPARHDFRYRQLLRADMVSSRMRTGSHYHEGVKEGLRAGYRAIASGASRDEAVRVAILTGAPAAVVALDFATNAIASTRDSGEEAQRVREEAAEVRPVLEWMVGHYFEATAEDFVRLIPVAIEAAFEVPVARVDGRGGPLWQAGVIDLAFYDRDQGDIVIDDHKTVDTAPWNVEKRVEMDPQTAGYVAGLRVLQARGKLRALCADGGDLRLTVTPGELATAKTGRVRYSVMRRARPHEPKVNQDGTVSVAAIDTTAEVYEAALARQGEPEWLAAAGRAVQGDDPPKKALEKLRLAESRWWDLQEKQAALLDRLRGKGDPYFARFEWWRSDSDIERWRKEFYVEASRIRAADRNPSLRTRSPGACTMPWSPPCEYRAICMDDSPEIRRQYRVADHAHEELERAKAEENASQ